MLHHTDEIVQLILIKTARFTFTVIFVQLFFLRGFYFWQKADLSLGRVWQLFLVALLLA